MAARLATRAPSARPMIRVPLAACEPPSQRPLLPSCCSCSAGRWQRAVTRCACPGTSRLRWRAPTIKRPRPAGTSTTGTTTTTMGTTTTGAITTMPRPTSRVPTIRARPTETMTNPWPASAARTTLVAACISSRRIRRSWLAAQRRSPMLLQVRSPRQWLLPPWRGTRVRLASPRMPCTARRRPTLGAWCDKPSSTARAFSFRTWAHRGPCGAFARHVVPLVAD